MARTKQITLPSGLQLILCKPGGIDSQKFRMRCYRETQAACGSGDPEALEDWVKSPESDELAINQQAERVCRQIVEPKFAVPAAAGSLPDGHRDINELDDDDYQALLNECDHWVREVVDSVRPTSASPDSSPTSGESRSTTAEQAQGSVN